MTALMTDDRDNSMSDPVHIIVDSGADAAVFPSKWLHSDSGEGAGRNLRDAQGNVIPTLGKRDVEIYVRDMTGRDVCLRGRVTISDMVNQPILCYGKLMEQGWSLSAMEQTAERPPTSTTFRHEPLEYNQSQL